MPLEPGYSEGTRVVHLTYTTLVLEALCGEAAELHGEPDLPIFCDDCLEHARALGLTIEIWVASGERVDGEIAVPLPLAA